MSSGVIPVPAGHPVGGPVSSGWREVTLTRAKELEALAAYLVPDGRDARAAALAAAIACHLEAVREAAAGDTRRRMRRLVPRRPSVLVERATSNLDAAEASLLNAAPAGYVLDQMPGILQHVRRHLIADDPRRQEFERLARAVGVTDPDPRASAQRAERREAYLRIVEEEQGRVAAVYRGACSAALREQTRVRSFRNVIVATTGFMTFLCLTVGAIGVGWPTLLPLCFAPEGGGQAVVVCPTARSTPFPVGPVADGAGAPSSSAPSSSAPSSSAAPVAAPAGDVDDRIAETVTRMDLLVVELVGLAGAAMAAAAAIRGIRGSSERYGMPVALAALKIPTGAITAVLGLLLMRGQFIPGLSALDTSAQILAWAVVFGYGQQLFTRLVDQQGHAVLDRVRGADKPSPPAAAR